MLGSVETWSMRITSSAWRSARATIDPNRPSRSAAPSRLRTTIEVVSTGSGLGASRSDRRAPPRAGSSGDSHGVAALSRFRHLPAATDGTLGHGPHRLTGLLVRLHVRLHDPLGLSVVPEPAAVEPQDLG